MFYVGVLLLEAILASSPHETFDLALLPAWAAFPATVHSLPPKRLFWLCRVLNHVVFQPDPPPFSLALCDDEVHAIEQSRFWDAAALDEPASTTAPPPAPRAGATFNRRVVTDRWFHEAALPPAPAPYAACRDLWAREEAARGRAATSEARERAARGDDEGGPSTSAGGLEVCERVWPSMIALEPYLETHL